MVTTGTTLNLRKTLGLQKEYCHMIQDKYDRIPLNIRVIICYVNTIHLLIDYVRIQYQIVL